MDTDMTPILKSEYIGLTEKQAEEKSKDEGFWFFHVASRDENQYPMSSSFCINRLAVNIKDNMVIKADQG